MADRTEGIGGRWHGLANALTGLRLASAPVCAFAIARGHAGLACLLFVIAVATDLADGRVARRAARPSVWGGFLDHATDATFVTLGLAAVAARDEVPAALPALVAIAFVQYTLDSKALSGQPLRASALGRWNGIAYFALLGVPVVRDALGLAWPHTDAVWFLGAALVASSLVSIGDRLVAFVRTRVS